MSFTYDALSRNLTQTGPLGTTSYAYDAAGRRTQMVYPAGGTALTVDYTYLTTGELTAVKQGATSLAAFVYDSQGRRASLTFANGVVQDYGYDPVSRLGSLTNNLSGAASDLTRAFGHNPASQITSASASNNAYVFDKGNVSETGTANGLNQLTSYAGKSVGHNAKGAVNAFGSDTFGYNPENMMVSANVGGVTTGLTWDPLMRLYQTSSGGSASRFAYDGIDAIAEHDGSGALQRRWVFDHTTGQPLIWFEGTGTAAADRRFLSADERGSIVSVSDSGGAALAVNAYDEYGIPQLGSLAGQRFGYTGQMWLPSAQLWHYRARVYHPQLGRFLQPDPIGYEDGMNLYAYVGNDPVNLTDPLGLASDDDVQEIIVVACQNGGVPPACLVPYNWMLAEFLFGPPVGWVRGGGGGGRGRGSGSGDRDRQDQQCRPSLIADVAGKWNAKTATAVGLLYGLVSNIAGRLAGTDPQISVGNNAIQFSGSPINIGGRAFTLGNVQVYGTTGGPSAFVPAYSGVGTVNLGEHEEAHTIQAELLGLGGYLGAHTAGGIGKGTNPLEQAADRYARGETCSPF